MLHRVSDVLYFYYSLGAESRTASMRSLLLVFAWHKKDEYLLFPWNELMLTEDSGYVSW